MNVLNINEISDEYISHYSQLLLNDTIVDDEEFDRQCYNIANSIKNLNQQDIMLFFQLEQMFTILDDNKMNTMFECYEMSEMIFNQQKKDAFMNLSKVVNNLHTYTKNEKILEMIINNMKDFFSRIFLSYERHSLHNNNDSIIKQNLSSFRLLKYCLENNLFKIYSNFAQLVDKTTIDLFAKIYKKQIIDIINKNKNNPEVLYIITKLNEEHINEIFKLNLPPMPENATYEFLATLITNDVPKGYIINNCFINSFQNLNLDNQISILEYLEDFEYPQEFINNLRHKLNKESISLSIESKIEMSKSKLKYICKRIEYSSYFIKNNIKNSELWILIMSVLNNKQINQNQLSNLYEKSMHLYDLCYNHATTSIVNNIYPLNNLKEKITYLENTKFNIFAISCNLENCNTPKDLLKNQNFAWGNILTENNFSHIWPEIPLFGFYTNINSSSIVHISPYEPYVPNVFSKYKKDLTTDKTVLLDIDDLNRTVFNLYTFSNVFIKTKTKNNEIITPDCIICLDKVNENSLNLAQKFNQKILVLKKNPMTIENNEMEEYHGAGDKDMFTPDNYESNMYN